MKRAAILISVLALAACADSGGREGTTKAGAAPEQVLSSAGNMAVCNDDQLEPTWDRAMACGDTIYRAPGTGSDIWIDPEFKCEYFLSKFYDGSKTRIGPGAPRMGVVNGQYIHICRA